MSRTRNTKILLGAALALLALGTPVWAQTGTPVKMLPPSQFGSDTPCSPLNGTTGLLVWDGTNPLRCVRGSAADAGGNVGISGSVGIGTLAPGAKLHVAGGDALFNNNLRVDQSAAVLGKLGIGTSNPWEKLHVVGGSARIDGALTVTGVATFTSNMSVSGSATVNGNATVSGFVKTGQNIQVGQTGAACNGSMAGAIRWNSSVAKFEGCDGSAWKPFGGGGVSGVIGGVRYLFAGHEFDDNNPIGTCSAFGVGKCYGGTPISQNVCTSGDPWWYVVGVPYLTITIQFLCFSFP